MPCFTCSPNLYCLACLNFAFFFLINGKSLVWFLIFCYLFKPGQRSLIFLVPGTGFVEDRRFMDRGWGVIQVHYSYYACYFYYISSTSDHQALDPRGWGPLDWTKVPPTNYFNCWSKNSILAETVNQPQVLHLPSSLASYPGRWAFLLWNSASFDGMMVVQWQLIPGKGGEGNGRMRVM